MVGHALSWGVLMRGEVLATRCHGMTHSQLLPEWGRLFSTAACLGVVPKGCTPCRACVLAGVCESAGTAQKIHMIPG